MAGKIVLGCLKHRKVIATEDSPAEDQILWIDICRSELRIHHSDKDKDLLTRRGIINPETKVISICNGHSEISEEDQGSSDQKRRVCGGLGRGRYSGRSNSSTQEISREDRTSQTPYSYVARPRSFEIQPTTELSKYTREGGRFGSVESNEQPTVKFNFIQGKRERSVSSGRGTGERKRICKPTSRLIQEG